ncbi:MAG TPA: 50S ribosomal protein L25 [Polyangiaceae bacterium]|jgi:large subunit ribosomal protein L25
MSSLVTLEAQNRSAGGKAEAGRLRRTGKIPAVAYGKDLPSTPLAVAPKDVLAILKSERGKNTVISMKVGGKDLNVMIRDYDVAPVDRALRHVDFVEVKLDKPVDVEIPLIAIGKPVGVTNGGILRQVYRTLPIRCLPNAIPLKVEADVTHLELGMAVATRDVKLPEGVTPRVPPEQTLIAVVAPEKEKVEEEAAPGAAAAGAPGAPGAAPGAAPAAGAAPAGGAAPAAGAAPAKEEKKKK